MSEQVYLDKPAQWAALVDRIRSVGQCGLDTEFHGADVKRESVYGRARVHVWSLALPGARAPLGFRKARGWVLPAAALGHAGVRALLEDRGVRKEVHNQSVDQHALASHGIALAGARNTLGLVRWKYPELVNQPGRFGLKALMGALLRREPVAEYRDVVDDVRTVQVRRVRRKDVTICDCGVPGCRFRRGHVKTRVTREETVVQDRPEKFRWSLADVVPGHPRWDLLVRYAAEDAVAALEIADLCDRRPDPEGWEYTDTGRPPFSQDAEDAVVAMETVGIPVDLEYVRAQLETATADEVAALAALAPWGDETVWASHPKFLRVLGDLGAPRSPVWKKGPVPRGETKVDQVALQWIAAHHEPSRAMITALIRLKRVRAGRKYLEKLSATSGTVHPICGPAGDADERAGAVTGRLGVKGELEAQQLPSKPELDFYQIRRAIAPTELNEARAPHVWRCYLQVHDELCLRRRAHPLIVADYAALEVVILADLCLRLFEDRQIADMTAPGAPDVHCVNAREVFGRHLGWRCPDGTPVTEIPLETFKKHPHGAVLRGMIKTVFYGLAYRKGAYGFQTLEDHTGAAIGEARAQEILDAFAVSMPGIFKWHRHVTEYIAEYRGMYSLGGRWCPLETETDDAAPEWLFHRAERRATNFPMQATAAEIVADAMVRVGRCPELVRPECTTERAVELLRGHMESATANGTRLLVPLRATVGTGANYAEAK